MLYGLSLSTCIRQLVMSATVPVYNDPNGDTWKEVDLDEVNLKDIVVFTSCKASSDEEWREVYDQYNQVAWNHRGKVILSCEVMAENLRRMGRIFVPRNHNCLGITGTLGWASNLEVVKERSLWEGEDADDDRTFYFSEVERQIRALNGK